MTPHVCPVCHGKGEVPQGFYAGATYSSDAAATDRCRSCSGSGVLWDYTAPKVEPLPDIGLWSNLEVQPGLSQQMIYDY